MSSFKPRNASFPSSKLSSLSSPSPLPSPSSLPFPSSLLSLASLPFLLLLAFFFLLGRPSLHAQVTAIYSDYGGYWTSSTTSMNPVKPDNSHNLLGFTWNGATYSTGVNDATLTSHSIAYTPCSFRAFPINTVPNTAASFYFVMLGQKYDGIDNGVDNGSANPFPANPGGDVLAGFLTDGTKGLDLGTGLANIPAGTVLRFELSTNGLSASAINDGIPDIFVTEEASPSSSSPDYFKFVDAGGNTVGNVVSVTTNTLPQLGSWQADFYDLNSTQVSATYINQPRPMAYYAADLSAFGITNANYMNAVALIYQPNGSSDPAFLAFNEPSVSVSTQLTLTSQPSAYVSATTIAPAPQVQVRDGLGQVIRQSGIPVTAAIKSGPGTLGGTLTVNTDANGLATFSNLIITGTGTVTLKFTSASLNAAVSGNITTTILPLVWAGFTAEKQGTNVLLRWKTAQEEGARDFLIERSRDGAAWRPIDSVPAAGHTTLPHAYSWLDTSPDQGTDYYRLRERDLDGRQSFSVTALVSISARSSAAGFACYPNPLTNGQLHVHLPEKTVVIIYSNNGEQVWRKPLPAGWQQLDLRSLPKGVYALAAGKSSSMIVIP